MSHVRSVNEFYDSIASDYNSHMTDSDRRVRDAVYALIKKYVAKGSVMDFGGGTGLDIPWFASNQHHVFFVEPSNNMRALARANYTPKEVTFIESNTDFAKWSESNLPFKDKMSAIVANFAVLNCIENIDSIFEKFALVADNECYLFVTVIDPTFGNMLNYYSLATAMKAVMMSKLTIKNQYKGNFHSTYIHSIGALKKASNSYFSLKSIVPLNYSSFCILVFKKI